jgi:hypothetical protein
MSQTREILKKNIENYRAKILNSLINAEIKVEKLAGKQENNLSFDSAKYNILFFIKRVDALTKEYEENEDLLIKIANRTKKLSEQIEKYEKNIFAFSSSILVEDGLIFSALKNKIRPEILERITDVIANYFPFSYKIKLSQKINEYSERLINYIENEYEDILKFKIDRNKDVFMLYMTKSNFVLNMWNEVKNENKEDLSLLMAFNDSIPNEKNPEIIMGICTKESAFLLLENPTIRIKNDGTISPILLNLAESVLNEYELKILNLIMKETYNINLNLIYPIVGDVEKRILNDKFYDHIKRKGEEETKTKVKGIIGINYDGKKVEQYEHVMFKLFKGDKLTTAIAIDREHGLWYMNGER